MKFINLTIGKKISAGFGICLIMLAFVGIISFFGIRQLMRDAEEVIDGNLLDAALAQKELDHLNSAGKVNALLTDYNVTAINIEINHRKCPLGSWLYGEERKKAETLVPELSDLFKSIEMPHQKYHESVAAITENFKQADIMLPTLLVQRMVDHLNWAAKIRDDVMTQAGTIEVETDPTKCALGKWLNSDQAEKTYKNGDAEFRREWDQLLGTHKKLHQSALNVQKALNISPENAVTALQSQTLPLLNSTINHLNNLKAEAEHEIAGMKKANEIYTRSDRTSPGIHSFIIGFAAL